MELSGHSTPYAVLGHPIGHTLSPVMHNAALAELGHDGIYLAFDVHPDRLMDVLPAMQAMGFGGVNLTIPHKQIAFEGVPALSPDAQLFGAANTVEFTPDGMVGHNTDGYGFLKSLEESFGAGPAGQSVCVLGTGGAGRALALLCAREGAASILLTDLDRERSESVAAEIDLLVPGFPVAILGAAGDHLDQVQACDLVIHATPVGMKPEDEPLLGPAAFRPGQAVFDLIYMYPETAIMRPAREAGARTANGLGMLLHQGARALEIWTGEPAPVETMRRALEAKVYPQS